MSFPIKNGEIVHSYVNVYQAGYPVYGHVLESMMMGVPVLRQTHVLGPCKMVNS